MDEEARQRPPRHHRGEERNSGAGCPFFDALSTSGRARFRSVEERKAPLVLPSPLGISVSKGPLLPSWLMLYIGVCAEKHNNDGRSFCSDTHQRRVFLALHACMHACSQLSSGPKRVLFSFVCCQRTNVGHPRRVRSVHFCPHNTHPPVIIFCFLLITPMFAGAWALGSKSPPPFFVFFAHTHTRRAQQSVSFRSKPQP